MHKGTTHGTPLDSFHEKIRGRGASLMARLGQDVCRSGRMRSLSRPTESKRRSTRRRKSKQMACTSQRTDLSVDAPVFMPGALTAASMSEASMPCAEAPVCVPNQKFVTSSDVSTEDASTAFPDSALPAALRSERHKTRQAREAEAALDIDQACENDNSLPLLGFVKSTCGASSPVPVNFSASSKFDGIWTQADGVVVARIRRSQLDWSDGSNDQIMYRENNVIHIPWEGETLVATMTSDEKCILWSDGDVWIRQQEAQRPPLRVIAHQSTVDSSLNKTGHKQHPSLDHEIPKGVDKKPTQFLHKPSHQSDFEGCPRAVGKGGMGKGRGKCHSNSCSNGHDKSEGQGDGAATAAPTRGRWSRRLGKGRSKGHDGSHAIRSCSESSSDRSSSECQVRPPLRARRQQASRSQSQSSESDSSDSHSVQRRRQQASCSPSRSGESSISDCTSDSDSVINVPSSTPNDLSKEKISTHKFNKISMSVNTPSGNKQRGDTPESFEQVKMRENTQSRSIRDSQDGGIRIVKHALRSALSQGSTRMISPLSHSPGSDVAEDVCSDVAEDVCMRAASAHNASSKDDCSKRFDGASGSSDKYGTHSSISFRIKARAANSEYHVPHGGSTVDSGYRSRRHSCPEANANKGLGCRDIDDWFAARRPEANANNGRGCKDIDDWFAARRTSTEQKYNPV